MKKKPEKTKDMLQKEKLKKALIKKATGYNLDEVVEEYVCTPEGEIKLAKRKITKKFIPPDIPAVKILLLEIEERGDLSKLSDAELEEEKIRLLKELEKLKKEE